MVKREEVVFRVESVEVKKEREVSAVEKKGLRRESNPGHLHPKQILYHLTTKPSSKCVCQSVMSSCGVCVKGKRKKEAIPVGVEPTIFRSGGECVSTAPQDHP